MKNIILIAFLVIGGSSWGQVFTEDFESGSGGYTASNGECTDGAGDYFLLTDGTNIGATLTGATGNFFAAADLDAPSCPNIAGANATLTWTGINITSCTGLSLSIDAAEDDDGANQDWDASDFVHIEVSIDAGPYVPVIWFESKLGTNGEPAADLAFDGTGDVGQEVTSTFQTFTGAIAGTGTSMDIRITFDLDAADEDIALDNLVIDGTGCGGCPGLDTQPTNEVSGITSSCITCSSFTLDWTMGAGTDDVIVVVSTSPITGTPTDGTQYGVGSTIAPGETVVYNGSGTTTTVSGLTAGTTYYYAIFSYNGTLINCEENYLTGGVTGGPITTDTDCSFIQSINYNSCNGTSEGTDEIVVVTVAEDVAINDLVINLPNTTWCNSGCGANTIINNAAFITSLNTMAGCTIFQYCDPIPAGSTFMLFTGNPPTTVLDYSGNCGGVPPPYCCAFLNNTSTTGNFSNSVGPKVTTIDFGCGASSTVSYDPNLHTNVDGATADFDANGNATYSTNVDCLYPLSLNLRSFTGYQKESSNYLMWTSSYETSVSQFEVMRSFDGQTWEHAGTVLADREPGDNYNYYFEDWLVSEGPVYYQLATYDLNGSYQYSSIIHIDRNNLTTYYSDNLITIGFYEKPNQAYTLNIYSLSGERVYSGPASNNLQIEWLKKGFFIVEIPELELKTKLVTR